MTSYVVLTLNDQAQWKELATVDAHSSKEALHKAYMAEPHDCRSIVAVPARSWQPQKIRTETKTRVVLESPASTTGRDLGGGGE